MRALEQWIHKAQHSPFALWILNRILARGIPFNAPHGFHIAKVADHSLTTRAPYRRSNFNHIKGIHACAILTIAEFASGMLLMKTFSFKSYRIIMANISAKYHYQAKMDLLAQAEILPDQVAAIKANLEQQDAIFYDMAIECHDVEGNHVATVTTQWQLKPWDKVKTKLS
jgi:acyl-coenzyme A thioesterase PaaI-like protein